MLTAFGFDSTTEKVYLAMLERTGSGIAELTEALDVGEDTVRSCLDTLAEASLIDLSAPTPEPIVPEVGLAALLTHQQDEVSRMQRQIDEGRLAVARLLAQQHLGGGCGTADTEQVIGIDAVRRRIAELADQCREEELIFSPAGRISEASAAASRPLDEAVLSRGVEMRTVHLDSVRNDESTLKKLHWEIGLGAEVRTVPTLPVRMIIIDREKVILPIDGNRSGLGALVLTNGVVVHSLVALFLSVWAEATPLGRARPRREGELTAQEQDVLRLWAQGHTDASAARRLGVSVRTVRRLSDNLTKRLRAQSRYQLGAKAIAKGWIKADDLI